MRASDGFAERAALFGDLASGSAVAIAVTGLANRVEGVLRAGGRLFFAGNGGSAADAQHLAAEYVGIGLPAIALTTDTSVLTALGNDRGFEEVFARQLWALRPTHRDLLFLHSTSGNSPNLVRAASWLATSVVPPHGRAGIVAMLARDGGQLKHWADLAMVVPTQSTALAQEAHLAIGHIVFEYVREAMGR